MRRSVGNLTTGENIEIKKKGLNHNLSMWDNWDVCNLDPIQFGSNTDFFIFFILFFLIHFKHIAKIKTTVITLKR